MKSWITTFSGIKIELGNPVVDNFNIEDIAHALSMQCRFNGHITDFYSVAQHSVLVSEICYEPYRLEGLLHDAAEAYLGDVITPVKYLMKDYGPLEASFESVIKRKFGVISTDESTKNVKEADIIMLVTEAKSFVPNYTGYPDVQPLKHTLHPMTQKQAKRLFLKTYEEICG